eukprot:5757817-Pleurochrysis_carterae.AAC.6
MEYAVGDGADVSVKSASWSFGIGCKNDMAIAGVIHNHLGDIGRCQTFEIRRAARVSVESKARTKSKRYSLSMI